MPIQRGHLYIIDFNPRIKTKPGKLRPALVIQSDLVNEAGSSIDDSPSNHYSACRKRRNPWFRLKKGQSGIARDSDLLLGQLIAVANESFRQEIGTLPHAMMEELEDRIRIFLSL